MYVESTLLRISNPLIHDQVLCEIERPRKNFKRGIIIAVGLLCVLYMLVNLSYVSAQKSDSFDLFKLTLFHRW
jgi:hypothetical protein